MVIPRTREKASINGHPFIDVGEIHTINDQLITLNGLGNDSNPVLEFNQCYLMLITIGRSMRRLRKPPYNLLSLDEWVFCKTYSTGWLIGRMLHRTRTCCWCVRMLIMKIFSFTFGGKWKEDETPNCLFILSRGRTCVTCSLYATF